MTAEIALAIMTPMVLLSLGLSVFQMLRPQIVTEGSQNPAPPNGVERPLPPDPRPAGLLIGPPMVPDPVVPGMNHTVRDYVLHYSQDPDVWSHIGAALYEIGAPHPKVGPYFHAADMTTLPVHFTRMLVAVCHTGVSERMLRTLTEKHARVTNPDGEPIGDEAYDIVKSVITMVITNKVRLPGPTIEHIGRILEVLRPAVVR